MGLKTLTLLPVFALAITVACSSTPHIHHVRSSRSSSVVPANLPEAEFVLSLAEKIPRPLFKKRVLRELCSGFTKGSLDGASSETEYLVDITVGGQHFKVVVDTGSSDTWLAAKGFKCFTLDGVPAPESECLFGSAGFDSSKSKTFKPFPDTNFNVTYGDGEFITGTVGFDTVTIAGLTVEHQEIGLATNAAWEGDSINTGLCGLAYPALTSVYNGTDPAADNDDKALLYSPFFFSAVQQKAVKEPVFSLALDRANFKEGINSTFTPHFGVIAFGGIAPVPVTHTSVTVPVQGASIRFGSTGFFFYSVDIESYVFPDSDRLNTTGHAILDSGTTLNFLPTTIAQAYNAQFQPPAMLNEDDGMFHVDCDAQVPSFSVTIGGAVFAIDPRDQIVPILDENNNVACLSGTQDGGPNEEGNIFILGDVFMRNVVATFNIQTNDIILSERATY